MLQLLLLLQLPLLPLIPLLLLQLLLPLLLLQIITGLTSSIIIWLREQSYITVMDAPWSLFSPFSRLRERAVGQEWRIECTLYIWPAARDSANFYLLGSFNFILSLCLCLFVFRPDLSPLIWWRNGFPPDNYNFGAWLRVLRQETIISRFSPPW